MAAEEKSIVAEYKSSLADLTFNSKPLINVLTMLAEENAKYGDSIVQLIADRVKKGNSAVRMPALYLLDSILKNVADSYRSIISKRIIAIFLSVFESADEKVRLSLFKLRNTWSPCFSAELLRQLDTKVKGLDPNWPIAPLPKEKGAAKETKRKVVEKTLEASAADSAEKLRQRLLQEKVEKATRLREQKLLEEKAKVEELLASQEEKRIMQKKEEERLKHELQLKREQQERDEIIFAQQREIEQLRLAKERLLEANKASHDAQSARERPNPPTDPRNRMRQHEHSSQDRDRIDMLQQHHEAASRHHNAPVSEPHHSHQSYKRPRGDDNYDDDRCKQRRPLSPRNYGHKDSEPPDYHRNNRREHRRLSSQERRQIIPMDKEMPRQMRMDQHQELMLQLERRLSSGELSRYEHNELTRQIEMLYVIQQKRNNPNRNGSDDNRQQRNSSRGGGGGRRSRWRSGRPPPRQHNNPLPRARERDDQDRMSQLHSHSATESRRPLTRPENVRAHSQDVRHSAPEERSNREQMDTWRPDDYSRPRWEEDRRRADVPPAGERHDVASTSDARIYQDQPLWPQDGNRAESSQQSLENLEPPRVEELPPQVEPQIQTQPRDDDNEPSDAAPSVGNFVGVADLFSRLIQSGIISLPSSGSEPTAPQSSEPPQGDQETVSMDSPDVPSEPHNDDILPEVDWAIDSLKRSHPDAIDRLCRGVQCSTCGLRFPPTEKDAYSDHLDWHFRVNKRDTDTRRATSRPWLLRASDWLSALPLVMTSYERGTTPGDASGDAIPVAASSGPSSCAVDLAVEDDDICDICYEPFEQYWDENSEEWRYKEAVRIDGRTFHEQCFKDVEMEEEAPAELDDAHSLTSAQDVSGQNNPHAPQDAPSDIFDPSNVVVKREIEYPDDDSYGDKLRAGSMASNVKQERDY